MLFRSTLLLPGMLLFGYLLVRFGRYLARDDGRYLVDFLLQTVQGLLPDEARPQPAAGTTHHVEPDPKSR